MTKNREKQERVYKAITALNKDFIELGKHKGKAKDSEAYRVRMMKKKVSLSDKVAVNYNINPYVIYKIVGIYGLAVLYGIIEKERFN